MLSGLLILLNRKCTGGFLLLIAVSFIMITRDNPYIHSNMKTIQKERSDKTIDILRNLVLVGASLLLMADRGDQKTVVVMQKK